MAGGRGLTFMITKHSLLIYLTYLPSTSHYTTTRVRFSFPSRRLLGRLLTLVQI